MYNDDDIVTSYSPFVLKRILQFLVPYKKVVLLTAISLLITTVAEIMTPVIIQRTVDENIIRIEHRMKLQSLQSEKLPQNITDELLKEGIVINDYLYVNSDALKNLSQKKIANARKSGWIDSEQWYVFDADTQEILTLTEQYPKLFEMQKSMGAIRLEDRNKLTKDQRALIQSSDTRGLLVRSIQYLILLFVILVATFVQVYTASWASQHVMADMRKGLLSHIMRQSLAYLGKKPIGSLVSRVTNDVETISEFFTTVTISFLKDISIMIGVIVVMFLMDIHLTGITLITLIPTIALILIFQNKMKAAFRIVRAKVSTLNAFLSEHISGVSTVQMFNKQVESAKEFDDCGQDLLKSELNEMQIMAVFRPLIDLILSVSIGLVIWYSTNLHESGLVTLGVLIAFIQLLQIFFRPVMDIAEKFNILQSAMVGSERVFAMLDTTNRIPDSGTQVAVCKDPEDNPDTDLCDRIEFDNVHFHYVPGEQIFSGLSFTIPAGFTTAIVGSTGSGKTTIANLLTRMWDPQEGRILLDGFDIRERTLDDLRTTVQPIQQDVFLFSGTISDNIDLGMGLNRQQIEEAGKLSMADTFIQHLPDGYETILSESASNLSAGQRQLIAFARIIAHDPRVLILDEATANIDTETEALVQEGMNFLLKDRTALIIAHRLSTIRRADHILVLGRGRLVEQGSHEQLMGKDGLYRNFYELQFSKQE